jgi:hypothetical protein
MKKAASDHDICARARRGDLQTGLAGLDRAEYRGLISYTNDGIRLTVKGVALLDGINPESCSGFHMGGPGRDWGHGRRT